MIPLRLLMVEDHEDDAILLVRELKKGGFDVSHQRVFSAEEMSRLLDAQGWDLVTIDYNMPGFDCFEALDLVKKRRLDLPCIVLSGAITDETAVSAMRAGAHDYVMKQNLKRLVPAVQRELEEVKVRRARKEAEERIQHQAYHDPLTGLPNLLLFKDRLGQSIALANRFGRSISVMALDLENFKELNNVLGWSVGDELLRMAAYKLQEQVREEDTLARFGEDEFLLFSTGLFQPQDALRVAQRIGRIFENPFLLGSEEVGVKATLGISLYPGDGEDVEELIKAAEMAMHRAKQTSRGSYQFYSPEIQGKSYEKFKLQNQLRKAFENEEFLVYYQPEVEMADGRISGCEALIRWAHPDKGLLAAAEFVPLAEESGLIVQIGEWVLRNVCSQVKKWQDNGYPHVIPAVNLSAAQFQGGDLVSLVADVLRETGISPLSLEFEVTESVAMQNLARTRKILDALSAMGCRISIDDFGTGYSSLAYLKEFPVNEIKIDRSFIKNLPADLKDVGIVRAVISLAHGLGIQVVAEGVETPEQLDCLRLLQCDKIQGYLMGRPVPPETFVSILRNGARVMESSLQRESSDNPGRG